MGWFRNVINSVVTFFAGLGGRLSPQSRNDPSLERDILNKIFYADEYDWTGTPNIPLTVYTNLIIDHIEELEQKRGQMTFHGSLIAIWKDDRIKWDYKKFNITRIVREYSELPHIYLPPLVFGESRRVWELLDDQSAMVSFRCDPSGYDVTVHVKISRQVSCHFDFTAYPFDKQNCSIVLCSREDFSKIVLKTGFPESEKDSVQGIHLAHSSRIQVGEFVVTNLDATRLILQDNLLFVPTNATKRTVESRWLSVVGFSVSFSRRLPHYVLTVVIPLFCISVVTYASAMVERPDQSIIWLLFCGLVQAINHTQMVHGLPPDQANAPKCAKMASLLFLETAILLLFRILVTYFRRYVFSEQSESKEACFGRIELGLQIILSFHVAVNIFYLFC